MAYLPDTIAEAAAGRDVRAAFLVELRFRSQTMRLWEGYGDLDAGGSTWKGARGLGQIEGLAQAVNGDAPQATLSLSGVAPENQAIEQGDPAEYVNRTVIVHLQFFKLDWSTLDSPLAVWAGTMQTVQESYGWDDSAKAWISIIGIACESRFVKRGRPPASFYSPPDQALHFPDTVDKGLDAIAQMQNFVIRWPDL